MFLEEFDSEDAPNVYKAFKDIATVQECVVCLAPPPTTPARFHA